MISKGLQKEWFDEAYRGGDDKVLSLLAAIDEAETRAEKAEAEIERLRDAECGTCGRSLAPDGDCHGCRADRLEARVGALREWAKPSVQDPTVYGAKNNISTGYAAAKKDARAILDREGE